MNACRPAGIRRAACCPAKLCQPHPGIDANQRGLSQATPPFSHPSPPPTGPLPPAATIAATCSPTRAAQPPPSRRPCVLREGFGAPG
eukprot:scaffold214119_cov30-Prasinocladus_malaysianus.AAC.1